MTTQDTPGASSGWLAELAPAEVVISVVFDDAAVREVALGPGGLVEAMAPGAIHVAMQTISPGLVREDEEVPAQGRCRRTTCRAGRNAERSFRGEKRGNETHASTTDPDATLYRKAGGQPSRLCFMGRLLIENRHGLIVDVRTTHATGRAERGRPRL